MSRIIDALTSFIHGMFLQILSLIVPDTGKRILLLSTLQLQLQQQGVFEDGALVKINALLQMVEEEDALNISCSVYQRIWNNDQLAQIISEGWEIREANVMTQAVVVKRVCDKIIDISPAWLKYRRREDMMEDLLKLFTLQPVHA